MNYIAAATPELAFNNESVTLIYHPDTKIVHHTIYKPASSADIRAILNGVVTLLQKHGASKWLSDDRGNGRMTQEDSEWSKTDWSPRAVEAGWKFWALVVPEAVKARMHMNEFMELNQARGLRTMVFSELQEATDWLEQQC